MRMGCCDTAARKRRSWLQCNYQRMCSLCCGTFRLNGTAWGRVNLSERMQRSHLIRQHGRADCKSYSRWPELLRSEQRMERYASPTLTCSATLSPCGTYDTGQAFTPLLKW